MIKTKKIRSYEKGFYFKGGEFKGLLNQGRYWFIDLFFNLKVDILSTRSPWIEHESLDLIVKSGVLKDEAQVIDLKDHQRALVWFEGRFEKILGPGLYALWTKFKKVRVEVIDANDVSFRHKAMNKIINHDNASDFLSIVNVSDGYSCLFFEDGKYVKTLSPGRYLFWNQMTKIKFYHVDMRENVLDISGQEILTSDKLSLRINALVSFRVIDALKSVTAVSDNNQAVYREAQLALRSVVGTLDYDSLLNKKDKVAKELEAAIKEKAEQFGLLICGFGIRDIILPGDMKELMNKVIEAKKAADANLIMRREETAAMRSQANTARLLENNPTLMRLRELDILEKVVTNSKMSVVLGEKGLTDRVINLL